MNDRAKVMNNRAKVMTIAPLLVNDRALLAGKISEREAATPSLDSQTPLPGSTGARVAAGAMLDDSPQTKSCHALAFQVKKRLQLHFTPID